MNKTETTTAARVKNARRVSTPLVRLDTPDPAISIKQLVKEFEKPRKSGEDPPVVPQLRWDVARGIQAVNDAGRNILAGEYTDLEHGYNQDVSKKFAATVAGHDNCRNSHVSFLSVIEDMPAGTVIYADVVSRYFEDPLFVQAVWNLRDVFKRDQRMLVLMSNGLEVPGKLSNDLIVFHERLPTRDEIKIIVSEIHKSAGVKCSDDILRQASSALCGLASFPAEQITAMSLRKSGLDMKRMWESKCNQINETPGLRILDDGLKFDGIGGLMSVKEKMRRIFTGRKPPEAVVVWDEIEKQMSGGEHDSSGVTQAQLGKTLTYMEQNKVYGVLFVGSPGTGKSIIAESAGNEFGVPTISLDFGDCKHAHVGESEARTKLALETVHAVSNGNPLFVATANSVVHLDSALQSRFFHTFFFDLPTLEERNSIWKVWLDKYELEHCHDQFSHTGWTGRNINRCALDAWYENISAAETAQYVIPTGVSDQANIEDLRRQANNRFLSASHPGVYKMDHQDIEVFSGSEQNQRKFEAEED